MLFDRSWYNRAGIETVMGFCTHDVVDFNAQRRGRLNVIRHLLDHVPDSHVPEARLDLPPLRGTPARERFKGPVKPIRGRY